MQKMVENGEVTKEQGRRLKPSDCRAPRLTGYPKIHKEAVPLRGVVSFIRSPYENIAKALVPILRTLQGRSGHYIKNSRQLKEIVKEWSVQRDEILVSYDVEKLYPSIPISKALELIECLLKCKRQTIVTVGREGLLRSRCFLDISCRDNYSCASLRSRPRARTGGSEVLEWV